MGVRDGSIVAEMGREAAALLLHCKQSVGQGWPCSGVALVDPTGGGQGGTATDAAGLESNGDPQAHSSQNWVWPRLRGGCGCGDLLPPELVATISKMGNYWFY